ncbi:hypothetical protein [Neobacillus sp. LXY-4]|uniref:hypothetical protein n=1 Tax=Neobacillus sp. LXY-4 TaxID=3379826 RepID=UPI003EE365E9
MMKWFLMFKDTRVLIGCKERVALFYKNNHHPHISIEEMRMNLRDIKEAATRGRRYDNKYCDY